MKSFSKTWLGVSILLVALSVGSIRGIAASGVRANNDPCGTGAVTGFPTLTLSICTAASSYPHGSLITIDSIITNTGSTSVTISFGLIAVGFNSKGDLVFGTTIDKACISPPCTVPPGGTVTETRFWNADSPGSLTSVPPGTYVIEGELLYCTINSTGGTSCVGGLGSAETSVTITSSSGK